MLGDRYVVKKGDNLWRIAARNLGGGREWPRIWKYNNRPEVVRLTGRRIPNPDLIYVGQILYIPRLPTLVSSFGAAQAGAEDDDQNLPPATESASGECAAAATSCQETVFHVRAFVAVRANQVAEISGGVQVSLR